LLLSLVVYSALVYFIYFLAFFLFLSSITVVVNKIFSCSLLLFFVVNLLRVIFTGRRAAMLELTVAVAKVILLFSFETSALGVPGRITEWIAFRIALQDGVNSKIIQIVAGTEIV